MGNGAIRCAKINTDCACSHFFELSEFKLSKRKAATELQLSHTVAANQEICCHCNQQNTVDDEHHGSANLAGKISAYQAAQRHAATEGQDIYAHDAPPQFIGP